MNDLSERIQEAVNLVRLVLEEIEDEEEIENLETAIEILEDVDRDMEISQEMDDMMGKYEDNIEDFDEI